MHQGKVSSVVDISWIRLVFKLHLHGAMYMIMGQLETVLYGCCRKFGTSVSRSHFRQLVEEVVLESPNVRHCLRRFPQQIYFGLDP